MEVVSSGRKARVLQVKVHVERVGKVWAVKHGEGFLGFADTEDEAVRLRDLLALTFDRPDPSELHP